MSNGRKVWLVTHPTSQFKEDVKDLARKSNLQIIDAKHRRSIDVSRIATDVPKLTQKSNSQLKKEAAAIDGGEGQ